MRCGLREPSQRGLHADRADDHGGDHRDPRGDRDPELLSYQIRSKRTEAMTNLEAIAKRGDRYFAENGVYRGGRPDPAAGPWPAKVAGTPLRRPSSTRSASRPKAPSSTAYDVNSRRLRVPRRGDGCHLLHRDRLRRPRRRRRSSPMIATSTRTRRRTACLPASARNSAARIKPDHGEPRARTRPSSFRSSRGERRLLRAAPGGGPADSGGSRDVRRGVGRSGWPRRCVAATAAVHGQMPDAGARRARASSSCPRPEVARASSLGFDGVLADYYWLQAVQIVGAATRPERARRRCSGA